MGNIRDSNPEYYRLITIRTYEARLWMIPTKEMRKLLGGIIARYQELCKIEIYAYCFLSNHYHLLIKAPLSNTDEFCENVNREIARRVNRLCRRRGKFWHKRYSDQKVVSSEDLLDAFLYVTTNAVRHGLVDHQNKWSGLSSYSQSLTEEGEEFSFERVSVKKKEERITRHVLTLSILPQYEEFSKEQRTAFLKRAFSDRINYLIETRRKLGKGFLDIRKIVSQKPGGIPREISLSPRPCCYSKDATRIKEERALMRLRKRYYWEASCRYRLGELLVPFPSHSFKPPLHRKPRLVPFLPLSPESFRNAA